MERTRSPLDDLGVLALMTTAPLMANALLCATAPAQKTRREESADPLEPAVREPEGEGERSKRSLLDRIDHWFWTLEQRAIEARLAQATDIYDLEVRIREMERGAPWWAQ